MGIYLHLQSTWEGTADTKNYENGAAIVFDKIIKQSAGICFDPVTGIITLKEVGIYKIDWTVIVQSTTSVTVPLALALVSSQGDSVTGDTTQRMGAVTGSAIITAGESGVTLSLVNKSERIILSGVPVIANLTVTSFSETPLGTEMSIINSPEIQILTGQVIQFNHYVLNENPNVSYNQETGEFLLSQPGGYLINWWLVVSGVNGISETNVLALSTMVNGEIYSSTMHSSRQMNTTLYGNTFIRVTDEPVVMRLENTTDDILIEYDQGNLQGGITIVQLR